VRVFLAGKLVEVRNFWKFSISQSFFTFSEISFSDLRIVSAIWASFSDSLKLFIFVVSAIR
jgi:hypothetical protein